jgi:hypothetical protein
MVVLPTVHVAAESLPGVQAYHLQQKARRKSRVEQALHLHGQSGLAGH